MRYIVRWTVLGACIGTVIGLSIHTVVWSMFAVIVGAGIGWEIGLWVRFYGPRRPHYLRDSGGHVRVMDR